jgi:uncharacterized membrane protein YjjP (DUF1212 family)
MPWPVLHGVAWRWPVRRPSWHYSVRVEQDVDKERAGLEDILQTSLAVGVQIHRAGGYTARTHAAMQHVAEALGAERAEPAITANLVALTVYRGGWSRTAMKSGVNAGVNFTELSWLSQLTKGVEGKTTEQVREGLATIVSTSKRYRTAVVIAMVGVAIAGLAGLFGADWQGMLVAGLAGAAGVGVRELLIGWHFKPFIFCVVSAFVSTATVMLLKSQTGTLDPVLAACVLYLVPGVHLVNGTADLVTGFYLNGVVRLTMSTVIFVGATTGLLAALSMWGLT